MVARTALGATPEPEETPKQTSSLEAFYDDPTMQLCRIAVNRHAELYTNKVYGDAIDYPTSLALQVLAELVTPGGQGAEVLRQLNRLAVENKVKAELKARMPPGVANWQSDRSREEKLLWFKKVWGGGN